MWAKIEADGLSKIQTQIKEAGLPTNPSEILIKIPDESQNAAPLLRKASKLVDRIPKGDISLHRIPAIPGSGAGYDTATASGQDSAKLCEFLADEPARKIRALLDEASTKEKCDFNRDYQQGIAIDIQDSARLLNASRILLNHAWFLAKDGNTAGAVQEVNVQMKMSEFCMGEPILIPWLVGIGCDMQAMPTVMNILSVSNVTLKDIDILEESMNYRLGKPSGFLLHSG